MISFLLTGLLVTVWHARFYRPSHYLTTELFFTLYCGLFLWVLYRMRQSTHAVAPWVRLALWTTPVWYHGASLAILGDQWLGLFVYLIAVTGVGMVVSVRWEAMWPRLLLWAAVVVPLLDWTTVQPDGSWLTPAVVTWIAVYQGYDCEPTSEGISRATTRTVVYASLAVLGLDFILTALMFGDF